jgi:histidyl-tRNA synthetase
MGEKIASIRGMHDILPNDVMRWQYIDNIIQDTFNQYGYKQIRTPILENTQLFNHSIGEITDIVAKEMYSFDDRSGINLSMRPEGTAPVVRSVIQHSLAYKQISRLWYNGVMFRYERPQKGRLRQFHQAGAEVFGSEHPMVEAELILMVMRLFKKIGIDKFITLEINSLGNGNSRERHKKELLNYFRQNYARLDEDSKQRLETNPLRILDSKNPQMQDVIENSASILDFLDNESIEHFEILQNMLTKNNIRFQINPNLVRGLDYYNRTVFEFKTTHLGSSDTICGGGRYDKLVETLGGNFTPAAGFAMGIERVLELVAEAGIKTNNNQSVTVFIILQSEKFSNLGNYIAEKIQDANKKITTVQSLVFSSLKNQFKKADNMGAKYALILGENEAIKKTVSIKFLQESKEQISLPINDLTSYFKEKIYD